MYRYDSIDQAIVDARVEEFRDQVARRLAGELDEDHFKPLRLKNGLYLQLHAYMLRVAIPYGMLSSRQLRMLAHIARRYDRGYAHFTTRQNIQYNWIRLEEAPDLLADLATVEMHAIQTSGNCIRNISADQYAGAAADEVADPRPWAELLRQWSSFHPEFSYLPRKFKIAVTGSASDRAAIRFHDIGLQLVQDEGGALGFRVFVGGGMGRTPFVGPCIREFLPAAEFLSYNEAILRVYNRFGRRDNIYKARIKILVHDLGAEEFARQVEAEHVQVKALGIDAPEAEVARIAAFFVDPPFETGLVDSVETDGDAGFARWAARQVAPHKVPGYRIVNISLKPKGGIPGDASAEQMEAIADLAERYSFDELRVTHAQNLVLAHVRASDVRAVYEGLAAVGLEAANLDLASDVISCPGLDYCTLANARSIPVAMKVADRLRAREEALGELKIKVSGCINACGHHHAGHIGILGVDRKGVENYQLLLGGSGAEDASVAQILGPGFTEDGIVDAVEKVTEFYLREREAGERFLDTFRRLGVKPFKEAVYG
ncbi:MAG: nitrite/sulfite reductase [Sphingomonadaceae bacterium]